MRLALGALLLVAAALPSRPPARALGEDPAKLRDQVLDGSFMDDTRLKAARELEKADPELLGGALLDLADKKHSGNLNFLVAFTLQEQARHLRLAATYAAWQSAPDRAAAAFLEKTEVEDDRQAVRAIEAVGLVAAVTKDRAPTRSSWSSRRAPASTPASRRPGPSTAPWTPGSSGTSRRRPAPPPTTTCGSISCGRCWTSWATTGPRRRSSRP